MIELLPEETDPFPPEWVDISAMPTPDVANSITVAARNAKDGRTRSAAGRTLPEALANLLRRCREDW